MQKMILLEEDWAQDTRIHCNEKINHHFEVYNVKKP